MRGGVVVPPRAKVMINVNYKTNHFKGVGEGGQGAHAPTLKSGGHKWVCAPPPPTLLAEQCSNFTICSYFEVKSTIFFKIFLARFARQL